MDIGKTLKAVIDARGITQIKLAELLNSTRQTVARHLSDPELKKHQLIEYLNAIGMTEEEFYGSEQYENDKNNELIEVYRDLRETKNKYIKLMEEYFNMKEKLVQRGYHDVLMEAAEEQGEYKK